MQKNISVIIPIKNQQSALIQTLKMFNKQVKPCDFEVIVVNDDQIDLNEVHLKLIVMPKYSLRIVNSGKCNGRAAARNTGVRLSNGDIIVFCDADRIPNKVFLEEHYKIVSENENYISIGNSKNYYGPKEIQFEMLEQFSRNSPYFEKIKEISPKSPINWATLLIGNSAMHKNLFFKCGSLNPVFKEWGFEHFEMGIRLQQLGCSFIINTNAVNYHLVHSFGNEYYKEMMNKSIDIMHQLHTDINFAGLYDFVINKISASEFEKKFFINNRRNYESI